MMSRRLVGGVACIFLALGGSGCALRDGDVALDGKLRIELSPPKGPVFYGVQVSQRDGELLVSGFGRRPKPQGHVEAVVIGPDGTALVEARAEPLSPRAVPKRTYNYRFQVALPIVPSAGSTLRVTYADEPPANSGADGFKNAHYMLRWVNTKGQKGPWSETATATIGA